MATNIHPELTDGEIHTPYRQVFANAAARTGDATVYDATDLYKKAYQVDTGEEYVLTAIGPTTWTPVAVTGAAGALSATLAIGNTTGGTNIEISAGDEIKGEDAAPASGLDGSDIILRPGLGDGAGADGEVRVEGKLTVTGLIDPTGLVLTKDSSTGLGTHPTASEGALFVSDGTLGLQNNTLYFVDASSANTMPLLGGNIYTQTANGLTVNLTLSRGTKLVSPIIINSGSVNATLPAASTTQGVHLMLEHRGDGSGAMNILRTGGDTINGVAANLVIPYGDSVVLVSDGFSGWRTFSQKGQSLREQLVEYEKTLGYTTPVNAHAAFDGGTSIISFAPAPNDLIMKKIFLTFVPNGGTGLFDPSMFLYINDIKIAGTSIMNGVVPSTQTSGRYRIETPVFNRLVTSGQVVTVELSTAAAGGGGTLCQPLMTYVDGESDSGLTKQTYLGLDPTVHTGPPLGGALFPGTGQVEASTVLTINTAPLAAGDTITFNNALDNPFILTGVAGAATPGSDDFDATVGTVAGMATEIANAINHIDNTFDTTYTATANTPGPGQITIEHFGGDIGNIATIDVSTTPPGGITPASASFSGGTPEIVTLTFEAAPADMTLNRLFTTVVAGAGVTAYDAVMDISSITVNAGPNLITGRIGTAYTANGPGDTEFYGAGTLASPNFNISISSGDIVRVGFVNNLGISGGVLAGWSVTLD